MGYIGSTDVSCTVFHRESFNLLPPLSSFCPFFVGSIQLKFQYGDVENFYKYKYNLVSLEKLQHNSTFVWCENTYI